MFNRQENVKKINKEPEKLQNAGKNVVNSPQLVNWRLPRTVSDNRTGETQKITLKHSPDGKIRCDGLRAKQQLIKTADGKFYVVRKFVTATASVPNQPMKLEPNQPQTLATNAKRRIISQSPAASIVAPAILKRSISQQPASLPKCFLCSSQNDYLTNVQCISCARDENAVKAKESLLYLD